MWSRKDPRLGLGACSQNGIFTHFEPMFLCKCTRMLLECLICAMYIVRPYYIHSHDRPPTPPIIRNTSGVCFNV